MREPLPQNRLNIKQVVHRYNKILKSRWWWQLRAPVFIKDDEDTLDNRIINRIDWFSDTIRYVLTFKKALPKPSR